MSEFPNCEVCGCTDYIKQSGFYVCANCDTQSQEIQEQSFDGPQYGKSALDDTDREESTIIEDNLDQDRELTSWEYYNYVLKSLVEQIIRLGASPELKVVAFQLWASYLQKANAAFFSNEKHKLPALPLGFKEKDAEILYGVRNLKKTIYKDFMFEKSKKVAKLNKEREDASEEDSNTTSERISAKRKIRKKQRMLALSQMEEPSDDVVSVSSNTTLESLGSHRKKRKHITLTLQKSTKEHLVKAYTRLQEANKEGKEMIRRVKKQFSHRVNYGKLSRDGGNMVITFGVLLSIIRVALLLTGDQIQLGDIMRWLLEGRLRINKPNEFLPRGCAYKMYSFKSFTRCGFQTDIQNFTKILNLSEVPTPDLYCLVDRYCVELCLPNDFAKYVHKIMNLLEPKMDYSLYEFKHFPDYEARVLAYIILAFKLLFSLDNSTERFHSEFAEEVNKLKGEEIPCLFSWREWVRYIECRKALLARFSVPINNSSYQRRVDNDAVFEEYWKTMKIDQAPPTNEKINPIFLSTLDRLLQKIKNERPVPKEEKIELPVSITPYIAYSDYLMVRHPHLVPRRTRSILETKFNECSIRYLIDYEWCKQIATSLNLEVEFSNENEDVQVEYYEAPEGLLRNHSQTTIIPSYYSTQVEIEREPQQLPDMQRRRLKYKKYKCKFSILEEDTVAANVVEIDHSMECDTTKIKEEKIFKIYNPSEKYWFLHMITSRTTNEHFSGSITNNLSDTFLWLLRECCNMICADLKDVYSELITIEAILYTLFVDEQYGMKGVMQMCPHEW